MKRIHALLLVFTCAFFLAATAHARTPIPIINLDNEVISAVSGKALTLDDVKMALARAGAVKNWTIVEVAPGHAVGTLVVRNKHTIQVDITYTEKTISFNYKSSVNMKYGTNEAGIAVIHPFYINWVRELLNALRVELARF